MADAIISRLATLKNLAVRPTNSVLKYAKGAGDPGQAASELQVDSVLAGTYQRLGKTMRISVQLIDHGATRWAGRYDLQGSDMLRFEDDVAQKVVEGLSVQLSGAEQEALKAPSTSSPEAYNFLLQTRAYLNDYFITSRLEQFKAGPTLGSTRDRQRSLVRRRLLYARAGLFVPDCKFSRKRGAQPGLGRAGRAQSRGSQPSLL